MDISIVVLTFNAKDITLKMLDSLKISLNYIKTNSNLNIETIVVDNGSMDGVVDEIERNYKWLVLHKGENVGFAKGNNKGVELTDKSSKYLLFLNPDIILEDKTILEIYQYMEKNSDIGVVTPKVNLWSGGLDWDCHRGYPTPWRALCYFLGLEKLLGHKFPHIFGGYHLLHCDFSITHEIDACLGAFMMIPRTVGEKINWWPTDYFLNGEDIDICYQIKVQNGHKVIYYPHVGITHFKGASKGTKSASATVTKASSKTKTVQINSGIESMEIFYKKYYEKQYPFIINKLVFLGIWILHKKRLLLGKE